MIIEHQGHCIELFPSGAIRWEKTLFVADLHLGKESVFQKSGLAIPAGATQKTLLDFGGLNGWVGVDLILGPDIKGSKDFVFEINPRLTTSYLGARHHLLINPASLWAGNALLLSQPESKGNTIVYNKNGTIEIKRGRTQ